MWQVPRVCKRKQILTSSPYLSSGTPNATAWATSGCDKRTASTSIGDIFSPVIARKFINMTTQEKRTLRQQINLSTRMGPTAYSKPHTIEKECYFVIISKL